MDSSSIDLKGSEIESIEDNGDQVKIFFSRAYIIKTMTGSVEKTRWYQAGYLIFDQVEEKQIVEVPAVCDGGDVGENVYTYRDMIPVPLQSHGHTHCDLRIKGSDDHLKIQAGSVKLEMLEVPKYIQHIRPE